MVQVIHGGQVEFDALIYGQPHPGTISFLQNQMTNLSQTLTDAGRTFMSGFQNLYEKFHGSEAMRLAKIAQRKVLNLFQPDIVRPLWELPEVQQATPLMQRFIMAQPEIRQMYHNQQCDGFSNTYVDMYPGQVGSRHYDYRRVMNGMVQEDEEGTLKIVYYPDEPVEGDIELSTQDKVDIISVWDIVAMHLKHGGEDPSSPYGASLQ